MTSCYNALCVLYRDGAIQTVPGDDVIIISHPAGVPGTVNIFPNSPFHDT